MKIRYCVNCKYIYKNELGECQVCKMPLSSADANIVDVLMASGFRYEVPLDSDLSKSKVSLAVKQDEAEEEKDGLGISMREKLEQRRRNAMSGKREASKVSDISNQKKIMTDQEYVEIFLKKLHLKRPQTYL